MRRRTTGFTITEILIVIGITMVIVGVSVPTYQYFQRFNTLDGERRQLLQQLRYSSSQSRFGLNDQEHGVYVETGQYTLYVGDSYAARDTALDQTFSFRNATATVSGVDINFERGTGKTDATVDIELQQDGTDATRTITVDRSGIIH